MSEFINLKYIAGLYEKMLGDDFVIGLNSIEYFFDDDNNLMPEYEGKHLGILIPERIPFAITATNCETVKVRLEFYERTDTDEQKEYMLESLANLLGSAGGEIGVGEIRYRYTSYLQLSSPFQPVVIDSGGFCSSYVVEGTILISAEGGPVTGNEIRTYITDGGAEYEVKTLSASTDYSKGVESPVPLNANTPKTISLRHELILGLVFLLENNALCTGLVKQLNMGEGNALDKYYTVRREIMGMSFSRSYALMGGGIEEEAGAYARIRLSLRGA